jgi:transposase
MLDVIYESCAGIDVHKKSVTCSIIAKGDNGQNSKETIETKEFDAFYKNLEQLAQWLKGRRVDMAVMESTGVFWKALYRAIEEVGVPQTVVNAAHVKIVSGKKTDQKDSKWLAELGRCGLLQASFIPPRDFRELRLITRYRRKLGGYLAGQKNRLHKILDDCGIKLGSVVSDIDGVTSRQMIKALIKGQKTPEQIASLSGGRLRVDNNRLALALEGPITDRHRFVLHQIHLHVEWIEQEMVRIDQQIYLAMEPYREEWMLLQTIPGINALSAAMLLAEIGVDMGQFGSKDRLCSWACVCPGNNESAGKKKSGRTRKGNRYLRSLLCEVAHSAKKTNSQFKGLYKGLVIRRGCKRATIAVAHKICEVIFIVLSRKEHYKDPKIDYQRLVVERNAPRWLQTLKKYGFMGHHC